jgi:sodium-dependent dicarboxylate transporter 2/3/5
LYLGQKFSTLVADWPAWLLVAAVCFLLTFLTELTSNVATVATLVPVLAQAAVDIELDPRLVMIPATIAASCAFMLPIATPPNAIVFGSGRIEMWQMVRYGIVLNLLGVVLITAAMFLSIVPQLGISLDAIPDWARPPVVPAN